MYRFIVDGFEIAFCSNFTKAERLIDRILEMEDQKYELIQEEISSLDHKYYFRSRNKNSRP